MENIFGGKVEIREKERTEVVRTFLFQSINESKIPDDQNLAALNFTNLVLLQKGPEAVNPGDLMPVGGKMNEGESVVKAGLRETVEETHLRPSKGSVVKFESVQDYTFRHPKKGMVDNRSHFLAGRLLPEPMDVAYGIDRAEDKIENFVSLSMAQGQELLKTGQVNLPDGPADLFDSLATEQVGVRNELMHHWQRVEAQKKMEVLNFLLKKKYAGSEEVKAQVKELIDDLERSGDRILEAVELWQRLINYFTVEEVQLALRHDNLKAKLENATENFDPETGEGVPTIEFILPLIMGEDLDMAEKKTLMANPVTARTLRMIQELQRAEEEGTDSEEVLDRLQEKGLLDLVDKIYHMEKGELLEEDIDFKGLGELISLFFEQSEQEAGTKFWDEFDEVKEADLKTLFGYASGGLTSDRFETDRDKRVLKWEAQRKIIMITLLNEVVKYSNEILKRGIKPIEDIEKSFLNPRITSRTGIKELILDSASRNRMIRWQQPSHYKEVTINRRTKTGRSQFRKMIVRDQVPNNPDYINDTFAGTYIFDRVDPKDLVIEEWVVPLDRSLRDKKGNVLESFKAPKVIADLMFTFWEAGKGQVEIIDYKELPPQGEGIKSSGPGGGADLRFAKFYVRHIDEQGVIRHKEYHVFVPDAQRNKSAQDEYINKIEDDKKYGMRRLFSTKGLRSLIELLFPAEVYGEEIKHIVKGKTS